MYKIIYSDKTKSRVALRNMTKYHEGNWPSSFLQMELQTGKDLIVISTYSNTIKVPFFVKDWQAMRVDPWEFRDFPLNSDEDIPESEWRQKEYEDYLQDQQDEEEHAARIEYGGQYWHKMGDDNSPELDDEDSQDFDWEERKYKEWLDEALIKLRKPDEL